MRKTLLVLVAITLGVLCVLVFRQGRRFETHIFANSRSHNPLLHSEPSTIWRDPGAVERLDFAAGPGGEQNRPRAPFAFLKELSIGTSPKIRVRDVQGRDWVVKWGTEAKAEIIATRIAWAAGYFVDTAYFVKEGRIEGIANLQRAAKHVQPDGSFKDARFELWDQGYIHGQNWSWTDNPFVGTRELNGLKIVIMLTSNWDNKDARDARSNGANTAIVAYEENGRKELRYCIDDWGSSMGKWGWPFFYRDKWNCKAYTEQTAKFIQGVRGRTVEWGFASSRDVKQGISIDDVKWVLGYLGRITDRQLQAGLEASGANPGEVDCFAKAIRARIIQMQEAVRRAGD